MSAAALSQRTDERRNHILRRPVCCRTGVATSPLSVYGDPTGDDTIRGLAKHRLPCEP